MRRACLLRDFSSSLIARDFGELPITIRLAIVRSAMGIFCTWVIALLMRTKNGGVDQPTALNTFQQDLGTAQAAVNNNVNVDLSQNQFDALTDFAYNVGTGNFQYSTVLKDVNSGQSNQVAPQMGRWTRGGNGLPARRANEGRMYNGGGYMQPVATCANRERQFPEVRDVSNRVRILSVVLFLGFSVALHAQAVPSGGGSGCPGDTVDRMGEEIAKQSRAFLGKLSKAVQEDDKKRVASMLHYPVNVHIADKTFPVHNPEEFMRNYGRIVNRSVKAKLLDEKSSRCLFSSPEGFMVGDGEVWFKEFSPGVFKVFTFNLGDSPNGDALKP